VRILRSDRQKRDGATQRSISGKNLYQVLDRGRRLLSAPILSARKRSWQEIHLAEGRSWRRPPDKGAEGVVGGSIKR
jgi:hypothetical protein